MENEILEQEIEIVLVEEEENKATLSTPNNSGKRKKAKNKKAKKRRWIGVLIGVVGGIAILAAVLYFKPDLSVVNEALAANQKVVYAELVQANGNEIIYHLTTVDEEALVAETESSDSEAGQKMEDMPEMDGEMSEERSERTMGERPGDMDGERPGQASGDDIEVMDGERPGGAAGDDTGAMEGERPEMDGDSSGEAGVSEESEELYTVSIPVGTEVTTKLGTVTTFSWLEAGDIIKMIVEEMEDGSEEIIAIEILE